MSRDSYRYMESFKTTCRVDRSSRASTSLGELVSTTRFWKLFGQLGAAPRCFLTLGFEGRTGISEGNGQTAERGAATGVGYSSLDRDHPTAMKDCCA
nr:hypothetical protein BaRGS_011635 [Batillaria attramentaria]